jgi:hypothetical protein
MNRLGPSLPSMFARHARVAWAVRPTAVLRHRNVYRAPAAWEAIAALRGGAAGATASLFEARQERGSHRPAAASRSLGTSQA